MSSDAGLANDIRPVVRLPDAGNRGAWVFVAILTVGAILLFMALDSRRQALEAPATTLSAEATPPIAAPPPLAVPGELGDEPFGYGYGPEIYRPGDERTGLQPFRPVVPAAPSALPRGPVSRAPAPQVQSYAPTPSYLPPSQTLRPFDAHSLPEAGPSEATAQAAASDGTRVRATRLAGPSVTVPQGTVIPAVLETALDSTRAGAVRAIVSRDVRGFDGSRVLIPRGSRLYGEYTGDLQAGQNRALIQWKKLTRPDGVQIALDSPASDPLGRAGVKGRVDSHFFERFGGAILQSVLDAGVAVASRKATDGTVIVGLPGSTQTVTGTLAPKNEVQRTLRVRQGSSVSVFVARDLDFGSVEP